MTVGAVGLGNQGESKTNVKNNVANNQPSFGMKFHKQAIKFLKNNAELFVARGGFDESKNAITRMGALHKINDGLILKIDETFFLNFDIAVNSAKKKVKTYRFIELPRGSGSFSGKLKIMADYLENSRFSADAKRALSRKEDYSRLDIISKSIDSVREMGKNISASVNKLIAPTFEYKNGLKVTVPSDLWQIGTVLIKNPKQFPDVKKPQGFFISDEIFNGKNSKQKLEEYFKSAQFIEDTSEELKEQSIIQKQALELKKHISNVFNKKD